MFLLKYKWILTVAFAIYERNLVNTISSQCWLSDIKRQTKFPEFILTASKISFVIHCSLKGRTIFEPVSHARNSRQSWVKYYFMKLQIHEKCFISCLVPNGYVSFSAGTIAELRSFGRLSLIWAKSTFYSLGRLSTHFFV